MAAGAAVSVYVSVPLHGHEARRGRAICVEARSEGARAGPSTGLRLRIRCLDDTGGAARWTLASVGANARRALQDSSTIAYVGEPEPAAARFSAPILESVGIAQITGVSGSTAISEIVRAINSAGGSGNLRESLLHQLR